MQRSVLPIAAVVLLVLAGCTSGTAPGAAPENATADSTPTPPPLEAVAFPDGASADGLNVTPVVEGHADTLADTSYTKRTRLSVSGRQNGSSSVTYRVDSAAERLAVAGSQALGGRTIRSDGYLANGTGYTRQRVDNRTQYDTRDQQDSFGNVSRSTAGITGLPVRLTEIDFRAVGTERLNGTDVIRYEGDRNATGPAAGNATATLLLGTDGVVRSVRVNGTGATSSYEGRISFEAIGSTTVDRPPWVDEAANRTPTPTATPEPAPEVSFEAEQSTVGLSTTDGSIETTAVTITHAGGDSVAADRLFVLVNRSRAGDLESLTTDGSALAGVLTGSTVDGRLTAGDELRVVHTVPERFHDAIRIDPSAGTITAGDGNVTDVGLSSGDVIRVVWQRSAGGRPQVLFSYTVE